MILAEQAEVLERQQTPALKNIYGIGLSAAKMRAKAGIDTLRKRRETMALKFAKKCLTNKRCSQWFVERRQSVYERRTSLKYPKFRKPVARTDRYRNSPKKLFNSIIECQCVIVKKTVMGASAGECGI